MNPLARRLVIAALLLGWVPSASAQTAEEIVEKYLAAVGGRAALEKLTSRSMIGNITVSTPGGDISGSIEVVAQAPNKSRTLIKLDLSAFGAGPMTIDQRFDGTSGYMLDSLQGNREITGGQLELMKNAAFPNPLLNYKAMGLTVELAGKEKVGERDAYVLIVKPKSGPASRQYVDAESFLPLKQVIKVDLPQVGELEQMTELLDQRDVDGVKVPFRINAISSVQRSIITITKVEHNIKIDETVFSKP